MKQIKIADVITHYLSSSSNIEELHDILYEKDSCYAIKQQVNAMMV